ncbi:MAG TPA: pectinesterase family protein [Tepidisphaeraceae bacterium]|nr:pectinesterase family protein [Tepidisphaeraceae bacterium]
MSASASLYRACAIAAVIVAASAQLAVATDYYLDPAGKGGFGDGTNTFTTIATALGSSGVPAGSSAGTPNRLLIYPGTYNVGTTSLSYSKANVALIGTTGNADDVVITSTLDSSYNPGSGALGTTGSATLQLKGSNVSAANVTFANSTDTPYIVSTGHVAVSPTGSYTGGNAQTSSAPAVALLVQGDGDAFTNVKVLGYQDSLYVKGGRAYFSNSTISGDNDFIFANGTVVFDHSTANIDGDHAGGAVTAASTDKRTSNGFVFLNSTITGNSVHGNPVIDSQNAANASGPAAGTMYLGRPWGWQQTGGDAAVSFINTKMTSAIKSVGWLNWNSNELNAANGKNGGNPAEDTRYGEYGSTDLLGNPIDTTGRVSWSHQFTASQAAAYSLSDIFSPEATYPWYGQGYPSTDAATPGTGSPNPTDPKYSWPAFWGDRNSNNDTANSIVSATYPTPGNPTSYSDPSWAAGTGWDPNNQLAAAVPEPASATLLVVAGSIVLTSRRRRRAVLAPE